MYAPAVAITRRTTARTPASESESPRHHSSTRRPRWGLLAHLRDPVPARRGCASLGAFDTAPAAARGPEGHAGPPRRARGLRRKATAVRAKLRVRWTFLARKTWIDVSPLRARQPRRREGRAWPLRRPVRAERGVDDVPPRPVWRVLRRRRPRLPRALCSSAQRLLCSRYVEPSGPGQLPRRAVPAQGRRTGDSGSWRLVRRKALLEARRPREHDRRRRLPHGRHQTECSLITPRSAFSAPQRVVDGNAPSGAHAHPDYMSVYKMASSYDAHLRQVGKGGLKFRMPRPD